MKNGGVVLAGALDKAAYFSVRRLPPFHDYKTRVVYSSIETVKTNLDIQHRLVKAAISRMGMDEAALEIFHASDLPGKSGTGSSSSFAVGLVHALALLQGKYMKPAELAQTAIYIEQIDLGEAVGCQDQVLAAHGGLNVIRFMPGGEIVVQPLGLSPAQTERLEQHLLLFFTKMERRSSDVAATYANDLGRRGKEQWQIIKLAEDAIEVVYAGQFEKLGPIIDKSWQIKASLSPAVSNERLNRLYMVGRVNGALGGKITGAGGGGSLLLVVRPEQRAAIIEAMEAEGVVHIPFKFCKQGSSVVFAD